MKLLDTITNDAMQSWRRSFGIYQRKKMIPNNEKITLDKRNVNIESGPTEIDSMNHDKIILYVIGLVIFSISKV